MPSGWLLLVAAALVFLYGYWLVRSTEPDDLGASIRAGIKGSRVGFGIAASTAAGATLAGAQLLGFSVTGLVGLDANIWTALTAIMIAVLQGLGITSLDPGIVIFGLVVLFIAIGVGNELYEGGN